MVYSVRRSTSKKRVYQIFEQRLGVSEVHFLGSFEARVGEICLEHLHDGRASSFAFIFTDFFDGETEGILQEPKNFSDLDALSGNRQTVFFLHASAARDARESFNEVFMGKLGLDGSVQMPCIAIFTVDGDWASNIKVVELKQHWLRGYHVQDRAIKHYLARPSGTTDTDAVLFRNFPSEEKPPRSFSNSSLRQAGNRSAADRTQTTPGAGVALAIH